MLRILRLVIQSHRRKLLQSLPLHHYNYNFARDVRLNPDSFEYNLSDQGGVT